MSADTDIPRCWVLLNWDRERSFPFPYSKELVGSWIARGSARQTALHRGWMRAIANAVRGPASLAGVAVKLKMQMGYVYTLSCKKMWFLCVKILKFTRDRRLKNTLLMKKETYITRKNK